MTDKPYASAAQHLHMYGERNGEGFEDYLTPATYTQVAKMFSATRNDSFHAGRTSALPDIARPNPLVPKPLGPKGGIQIDNHLSGTGQPMNVMSSVMEDTVVLDNRTKSFQNVREERSNSNKYRNAGVRLARRQFDI